MKIDPRIAQTKFLVEADSFAYQQLWQEWRSKIQWIDQPIGVMPVIAKVEIIHADQIKERSICLSLRWAMLEGHLVCFWCPTSTLSDYEVIETWLQNQFQIEYGVNAENFPNLLHYLESQNESRKICSC